MVPLRENIRCRTCVQEDDLMMSEVGMGRQVVDHRKATVSQTDSGYNQDKQSSVTEHTTRPSLKQFTRKFPHQPLFYEPNSSKVCLIKWPLTV